MQDPNIINPITNPLFYPILQRFIWLFIAGLVLIWALNKFKFRGLWQGELGKRYLSWLVIGALSIFVIFLGGIPSLCLVLAIILLSLFEIKKIAQLPNFYFIYLCVFSAVSVIIASYFEGIFYMLPLMYFLGLTTVSIKLNDRKGLFNLSLSLYAAIWIIFALCHFILLGHLNNNIDFALGIGDTNALLFLIGFAVPLADIGAYVVGKAFSKTYFKRFKIADKISPNKTYAGVLGDIIGAAIGIWIMYFAVKNYFSILELVILACMIGFFSVIGDLNESLFKRYFGVKDSGNLIPGHGGILDRIDSVLRVIVIVYYFSLTVLSRNI